MSKQNKIQDKSLKSGERQIGVSLLQIEPFHLWRYEEACKYITKNDIVLDLGCGVGYGSFLLAKQAKKVLGIDDSQEVINYANKYWKTPNMDFSCMSALSVIGEFDVVVALEIIEHIKSQPKIFQKLKELTKSKVIFSVPHNSNLLEKHRWHWRHYSEKSIRHWFEISGFTIERLEVKETKNKLDIFGVAQKVVVNNE